MLIFGLSAFSIFLSLNASAALQISNNAKTSLLNSQALTTNNTLSTTKTEIIIWVKD